MGVSTRLLLSDMSLVQGFFDHFDPVLYRGATGTAEWVWQPMLAVAITPGEPAFQRFDLFCSAGVARKLAVA